MKTNFHKKYCQKWDSNPRPQRGPEQLNLLSRQGNLESGALDRSAILTDDQRCEIINTKLIKHRIVF